MVAPVLVHAVWRGQCWPLQCLMCRLSALSSAGMEPAVSAFVSVQPSAGAAVSESESDPYSELVLCFYPIQVHTHSISVK